MHIGKSSAVDAPELRRRAEERLAQKPADPGSRGSGADMLKLIHELEVHQIELELQNEELREARLAVETSYNELYDFAPVGYFTLDASGLIVQVNLTGAGMAGRPRSEVVKQRLRKFVAAGTRDRFDAFMARVFHQQGTQSCMVTLLKAGTTTTPLEVYLEATPADSGDSCRAVAVDITSTRQAEAAHRESEERLKLAVAAAHLGVWEWDSQSKQIFWSPECCTISGVNQLCLTPESFVKLVHPKDLDRVAAEFQRALTDANIHSVEFHIVRPDGEVVWISVLGRARRDEEDNTLRVFGVAQDLTERKRGAEEGRVRGAS